MHPIERTQPSYHIDFVSFSMGLRRALITRLTGRCWRVWNMIRLTTVQAVQDLATYFMAAKSVDTPFVCFLNSYCRIQEPGWLEKLYRHARSERVGVVGATGSHGSPWNDSRIYEWLPKNRYLRAVRLRLERWLPGRFPAGSGQAGALAPPPAGFSRVSQLSYSHKWVFIAPRSDDRT